MSDLSDGAYGGGEADPGIHRFGLESGKVLGVEAISLNGALIDAVLCTRIRLVEGPLGDVELLATVPDRSERRLGLVEPETDLNLMAALRPGPINSSIIHRSRPGLLLPVRVTAPEGRMWVADRGQDDPSPDETITFVTGDRLRVVLITKWVDLELLASPAA